MRTAGGISTEIIEEMTDGIMGKDREVGKGGTDSAGSDAAPIGGPGWAIIVGVAATLSAVAVGAEATERPQAWAMMVSQASASTLLITEPQRSVPIMFLDHPHFALHISTQFLAWWCFRAQAGPASAAGMADSARSKEDKTARRAIAWVNERSVG